MTCSILVAFGSQAILRPGKAICLCGNGEQGGTQEVCLQLSHLESSLPLAHCKIWFNTLSSGSSYSEPDLGSKIPWCYRRARNICLIPRSTSEIGWTEVGRNYFTTTNGLEDPLLRSANGQALWHCTVYLSIENAGTLPNCVHELVTPH